MLIKNAYIYRNHLRHFLVGDILVTDGIIRKIGQIDESADTHVVDATGFYLVPGLVDVHTHGRMGVDFVESDPREYGIAAADYAARGITTVMPTLATSSLEQMLAATDALTRFTPGEREATFGGVHWEGRYLSLAKRGAHAPELLAPLNASELTDNAELLRRCRAWHVSAAYELDEDGSFLSAVKELGGTAGLGHTEATYAQAKKLEKKGISSYTHLFNAMPPLHHRDGGAVGSALMSKLPAELICDGVHISPEMVRLVYRMNGVKRISLISDSLGPAGCPDGEYFSAGLPVTVRDGVARTESGALAGSTLSVDRGLANLMEFCGLPLTEAILCATEVPARQVGIFGSCGSLDVGKRADILLLSSPKRLEVERVLLRGRFL